MTIWQLEQERQIGWKKTHKKKSTKNNFYLFLIFFKELAGFEPATLDFWVLLFYETLT